MKRLPMVSALNSLLLLASLSLTVHGQDASKSQSSEKPRQLPACRYCPDPPYSEQARKAKIEASVVLELIVTEQGTAKDVRVTRDPGYGLAEKALEAVKKWKFKPATDKDGKPVEARTHVEVVFRMLK